MFPFVYSFQWRMDGNFSSVFNEIESFKQNWAIIVTLNFTNFFKENKNILKHTIPWIK